mgnify:CR=1 FL=1
MKFRPLFGRSINHVKLQKYDYCLSFVGGDHSIRYNIIHKIKQELNDKSLTYKFILSTGKSAGAALDIKNLEVTIDLADPAKSPVIIRQKLGRTRDWNTLFIDIIDIGFPALRFYYKQRLSVFKKYAKKINPPKYLEDKDIRNKILEIQGKSKLILEQAQERKNLKEVMSIHKQVIKFDDPKYNYFQNYKME